jgi:protein-L-isoaspartate(D-aspartate) O-methyltransferase
MTDCATARRHMVDSQIRTADVTDLRILAAMLEIPRENFVPSGAAGLAYLDLDLAVGEAGARRLLKPMVLAKLIHAANVASSDRVLDVGCGTGYAAAILSRIAGQVITLEQDSGLAQTARTVLASQPNVSVVSGPLIAGWPQGAPYDVIFLEGATEIAPQAFLGQLKNGGRLVCVLGSGPGAKAMRYYRSGEELGGRPIFDASAAVLPGFAKAPVFAF